MEDRDAEPRGIPLLSWAFTTVRHDLWLAALPFGSCGKDRGRQTAAQRPNGHLVLCAWENAICPTVGSHIAQSCCPMTALTRKQSRLLPPSMTRETWRRFHQRDWLDGLLHEYFRQAAGTSFCTYGPRARSG
jgi:hypothetical protein